MVFRSYELKKNIYYKEVLWETKEEYISWINKLIFDWWKIKAIICDWKPWLFNAFWNIPVQMCHFHQQQIVTRYITKKPKLEANKELKDITSMLWKIRKSTFKEWLEDWCIRYKRFLSERSDSWWFKHKRTRSAYRSIVRNIDYLFTYETVWFEIPKTTNSLEWTFAHVKDLIRLHRWLKKERKLKLIYQILSK